MSSEIEIAYRQNVKELARIARKNVSLKETMRQMKKLVSIQENTISHLREKMKLQEDNNKLALETLKIDSFNDKKDLKVNIGIVGGKLRTALARVGEQQMNIEELKKEINLLKGE